VKGTQTLYPGVYCGGIQVTNGNTANLTPGTYIIAGGGLTVNGGNMIGTGVTFYNTNTLGSSSGYKAISLGGNGTFNVSAPTSGSYEGILIFQDRSIPLGGPVSSIQGGNGAVFNGALYFPTTQLTWAGGSASSAYTIIVADQVMLTGNSAMNFNANYSSLTDGSPIRVAVLGE
jgi:hypothetical protein